jgi:hypothetical protein
MGFAVSEKLDVNERKQLKKLVKRITEGMAKFQGVAADLLEIQETKLWRGTHKSFHAFCKDNWGCSKSHSYYLTGVAKVRDNVSELRTELNDAQAHELVGLEPEEQVAVLGDVKDEVKETGEPITAVAIKEKVELHTEIDEPYVEPTEAPEPPEIDRTAIVKKGRKALGELVRALDDLEIDWGGKVLSQIKEELK